MAGREVEEAASRYKRKEPLHTSILFPMYMKHAGLALIFVFTAA